jgi:hypothetical protein
VYLIPVTWYMVYGVFERDVIDIRHTHFFLLLCVQQGPTKHTIRSVHTIISRDAHTYTYTYTYTHAYLISVLHVLHTTARAVHKFRFCVCVVCSVCWLVVGTICTLGTRSLLCSESTLHNVLPFVRTWVTWYLVFFGLVFWSCSLVLFFGSSWIPYCCLHGSIRSHLGIRWIHPHERWYCDTSG